MDSSRSSQLGHSERPGSDGDPQHPSDRFLLAGLLILRDGLFPQPGHRALIEVHPIEWVVMSDPEGNEFCVLKARKQLLRSLENVAKPSRQRGHARVSFSLQTCGSLSITSDIRSRRRPAIVTGRL